MASQTTLPAGSMEAFESMWASDETVEVKELHSTKKLRFFAIYVSNKIQNPATPDSITNRPARWKNSYRKFMTDNIGEQDNGTYTIWKFKEKIETE